MPRRINPAGVYPLSPPNSFIFRQTSCLIKRNHYICCQNHVRYIYRLELTAMRNIILFIFIILTVHLNMSARGSGEKPSIVVLHSINFEESWTKQTYLDIENKFGKEGFTVKAIPLQIPGIRTMEGFQEKRKMILERVPVPPTLVVCIGDPSWLITRPLFDKEWKDIPSIICYARDYMYPKEEYLIDLDACRAAIAAGYSETMARTKAYTWASNGKAKPHVYSAILKAMEAREKRTNITADRVLTELAKIGFSDIRKAVKWQSSLITEEDNPDGGDVLVVKTVVTNNVQLVASEDLDADTAACIAEVSQNASGGMKIKLHDKRAALVDIGRHLGMFKEKLEVSGEGGGPMEFVIRDMTAKNGR